ncbi:hypothetical protein ACF0H5_023194 [Mactra antiquata]
MASCSIDVYVKLPSGKAVSSQHHASDTVRQIASHVARGENLSEERVRLKYQGKVIDKSKTIRYLGICAETILKAEILFPKDITLTLKFPDGHSESVQKQNLDKVRSLKQTIDDIENIPCTSQVIKTNAGQILSDNDTILHDYGVVDGTTLTVSRKIEPATVVGDNSVISDEVDEEKKMEILNTFDAAGRNVEVVFCFDTTGSMYSCLSTVRENLRRTCRRLLHDVQNIRIGIMAIGDYIDYNNYVVRYTDLTSDVDTLVDFAKNVSSTTGGDAPEAYEWALRKAQQLDWSVDSAKALVIIGDELPHAPSYTDQNLFWKDEVDVLAGMGVKVYGVQAMNRNESKPFYEELAERTNGFYLQLKDFNLITDMFLAVCYREADPGQLDAFVEEVQNEGRMTENTKLFLDKLDETKITENKETNPEQPILLLEIYTFLLHMHQLSTQIQHRRLPGGRELSEEYLDVPEQDN